MTHRQKLLIDSDVIIEYTRGSGTVAQNLVHYQADYRLCISAVSRCEVLIGSRNKQELKWLLQLLEGFETCWLNEQIAQLGEKLLIDYNLSHHLQLADALIAATAIYHHYPLLSRNQKDFRYIDNLVLWDYPI